MSVQKVIEAPREVRLRKAQKVLEIQFHFSDGHYRGLYPWGYLRELADLTGGQSSEQVA